MLQIRLEGDQAEALAFLDWIRSHGGEVQVGTVKARREGFSHVYGSCGWPSSPANSPRPAARWRPARARCG